MDTPNPPPHSEVAPDSYLGTDGDGNPYWLLYGNVYRYDPKADYTTLVCGLEKWETHHRFLDIR